MGIVPDPVIGPIVCTVPGSVVAAVTGPVPIAPTGSVAWDGVARDIPGTVNGAVLSMRGTLASIVRISRGRSREHVESGQQRACSPGAVIRLLRQTPHHQIGQRSRHIRSHVDERFRILGQNRDENFCGRVAANGDLPFRSS